ncbi:MAG: 2-phosphosulfolactate phosphatase [Planctomycetota bacterium]|nr:2-phosphosulfolactate phosphatase [Planctomycetota bacterium]MDA1179175.1 2-phosphosulfolactate phosphatase [Planctomycetota bacterium]
MPIFVHTYFLPDHLIPRQLAGATAVVADILRATTCIVQALANGATQVIPVLEVDEARRIALDTPNSLLVGERHGQPLPGFDLGNSPGQFTPSIVAGRSLIMTTTNGTKALLRCREADRVLVGSFLNISLLVQLLTRTPNRLYLVCAGTDGQVTREDVLFAGALITQLRQTNPSTWEFDDASRMAETTWLASSIDLRNELAPQQLAEQFAESQGGRNLIAIGHRQDLEFAAVSDSAPVVPWFDPARGSIQCVPDLDR